MATSKVFTRVTERGLGALAYAVSKELEVGDVVLLGGPLAAGKTSFVKAVALALGSADPVSSPTYTIAHTYVTHSLPLLHIDVYRITGVPEYLDLGLEEQVAECVTFIEWGGKVAPAHPGHLSIDIRFSTSSSLDRDVTVSSTSARWRGTIIRLSTTQLGE